jgi:uncharacterized protein YjbJ (UPF0337 family)
VRYSGVASTTRSGSTGTGRYLDVVHLGSSERRGTASARKNRYIRSRLKANVHGTEVKPMGGDSDKFAGKVREGVGDLTGDNDLKAEGKKQQVAGDVKNAGQNVKDKAEELGEKIKGD